jgi:hypothetical protein
MKTKTMDAWKSSNKFSINLILNFPFKYNTLSIFGACVLAKRIEHSFTLTMLTLSVTHPDLNPQICVETYTKYIGRDLFTKNLHSGRTSRQTCRDLTTPPPPPPILYRSMYACIEGACIADLDFETTTHTHIHMYVSVSRSKPRLKPDLPTTNNRAKKKVTEFEAHRKSSNNNTDDDISTIS